MRWGCAVEPNPSGSTTTPPAPKSASALLRSDQFVGVKKSVTCSVAPGCSFSRLSPKSLLPSGAGNSLLVAVKAPLAVETYRLPLASVAGPEPDIHNAAACPFGAALNTDTCARVVAS